jgi:hypothetical protein
MEVELMKSIPRPPRMGDALSRTAWLTGSTTIDDLLREGADDTLFCSPSGLLSRLVAASSPWVMLLPHSVWVASYGLLWAWDTGRIDADDGSALRRMDAPALCRLVLDIGAACPRPTDVEVYMTARALGRCA